MECLIQIQSLITLSNITLIILQKQNPSPLSEDREGRSDQSIISIIHTPHHQFIWFNSFFFTFKSVWSKKDGLKLNQISFIIHSIIHTLKYYWTTLFECIIPYHYSDKRRKIGEIEWWCAISNITLNHNRFNRTRYLFHLSGS